MGTVTSAVTSFLAALTAFLIELGRTVGVKQATEQIAADATRESEAARAAVAKAQAEAKAKGDVIATLRRGEL
jgi:translation initiation factor 2B subunit (eIF-2B alpha/beta/delta family)